MLLDRHRIVGAALDRGIVGHDHALPAHDAPNPGDQPGGMDLVLIHAEGRHRRDLEERAAGIEKLVHPLAGKQLSPRMMALAGLGRPAAGDLGALVGEVADEFRHRLRIGAEVFAAGIDRGDELGHGEGVYRDNALRNEGRS
jgi:hypothetical protein